MKLYYSNTSPYSRKVRLVIIEKGLEDHIEEILVNPFGNETDALVATNPLGKIPTLQLDNGSTLYDSPVICRYLDSLKESPLLLSNDKEMYWDILRWEAMTDGMTDAAYNLVMERKRPVDEQSITWITRWSEEIQRVLEYIEAHIKEILNKELTLAQLALASAIGYLEFRLPEVLYDSACPKVSVCPETMNWYQSFKKRPAMIATIPFDFK